ncbi:MAG: transporter [Paracoccaceae bacterium]
MSARLFMAAACVLGLCAGTALAREPGTPAAMPGGATAAVPVGANPPPGLYFASRSELYSGDVFDGGGVKLPIPVDAKVTVLQFHWVPETEILGASYRAMLLVPLVDLNVAGERNSGIGDITLSPLNLSWMLSPGVFVQTGLSLGIPTGDYRGLGAANLGTNVRTTALDVGLSYLKDGWNLSVHANYIKYGTNRSNGFKSGDELLVNWTAMKSVAEGHSLGLTGYVGKQLQNDKLGGAVFGDGNRGSYSAIGIGYSRNFGATELNMNLLRDISVRNEAGGTRVQMNLFTPLKF